MELEQYVPRTSLPAELGGSAAWTVEAYIAERAAAEGVSPVPSGVAEYCGIRLNLKLFDRLDLR